MMIDQAYRNRFWSKVVVDGKNCWEWTGCKGTHGYGQFRDKTVKLAHRVAYELTHGNIPAKAHIMHTCDNPSCCNPAHLQLGSAKENHEDKATKGRGKWESQSRDRKIKLTDEDVLTIYEAFKNGERNMDIAARYNVDPVYVAYLKAGKYRAKLFNAYNAEGQTWTSLTG